MIGFQELTRRQIYILSAALSAVLLIAMVATFRSCRPHTYPAELVAADSLCDSNADSALTVLQTLSGRVDTTVDANRWYIRLLKFKQKVKSNASFTDDKEAKTLVDHYDGSSDKRLFLQSLYCAGCVYHSLGDIPQAIKYFQKIKEEGCDEKLNSLCSYKLGYLLMLQGLYKESLPWLRHSLALHQKNREMNRCIYDHMNLSWAYTALKKPSLALEQLVRARAIAVEIGDRSSLAEVDAQMANHYVDHGRYAEASEHLRQSFSNMCKYNSGFLYSTAFHLYSSLNNVDSASYYCRKVIESGNFHAKRNAYFWLAKHYMESGDKRSAYFCIEKFKAYADTVEAVSESEASAKANALYNYNLREIEVFRLQQESSRKDLILVSFVFILVVLLLAVAIIIVVIRNRNNEIRKRIQLLKLILNKYNTYSKSDTECNKVEVKDLVIQLDELKENIEYVEKLSENNSKKNSVVVDSPQGEYFSKLMQSTDIYKEVVLAVRKDTEQIFSNWKELKRTVFDIYPNFETAMLNFREMSDVELRVCLLIRVGIPLPKIGYLTCRSTSSVYSICKRLYYKNFGKDVPPMEWYNMILSIY